MKIVKKKVAMVMAVTTLMSVSVLNANAKTAQWYKKQKASYDVYTISTSKAPSTARKIDAPGIKKTNYTTGSVTVSKSQSYTVNASASVNADFTTGFGKVGASVSVGLSKTTTVSTGTVIKLEKNAPNGIYYAYLVFPRKKVDFKVQKCSLNHTSWYTKYEKTIAKVPSLKNQYLEFRISK